MPETVRPPSAPASAAPDTARTLPLLLLAALASMAAQRIGDAMLPELSREFGVGLSEAAQVVSVFALAYGLAQLFYGPLGDRFGKLRVLVGAALLCAAGSLAAVWAGGLDALLVTRLVVGLGAAGLIPLGLAWVGDHVPYEQRQVALARIGLANYFAGALLMPYTAFLRAAEEEGYDIERLGQRFGVGFEAVCHRLSMLQRPQARGIPFIFIRVDRAGNISKRQSATHFHFSRIGGTCPLWNVYEAFAQPGRIVTQLARMPDGRTYLWVARTVQHGGGAWGAPGKLHAVALGCDIEHAPRWVYSKGLNLADPAAAVPIGMGCKVCERTSCPQRAFPPVGRAIAVDERRSSLAPYPVVQAPMV